MSPFIAEVIGTSLLILMGSGVVANTILSGTKGHGGGWIVITSGWAFGVFIAVVVAGPFSGAHINPAVTLSFAVTGLFPWDMVMSYILAQAIGAAIGAAGAWLIYRDHFNLTTDPELIRAVFCTSPAIRNIPVNFATETIGTFVLLIVVLYNSGATIIQPDGESIPIGLGALGALPVAILVWVIGLSLGGATGYAINPARDLVPRIVHALLPIRHKGHSDWSYAWVPVIAPLTGGCLAAVLYLVLQTG